MAEKTTLVTVPCLSGAPWARERLGPLAAWPIRTMRLPEGLGDIEGCADFVGGHVRDLDRYVLLGDSFGALVALAFAARRPSGLRALVLSGAFAIRPVRGALAGTSLRLARFLPGVLYRELTLRLHARALASPHDDAGEVPWSPRESRALFRENTPHRSYVARVRAALGADYRAQLGRIRVPTLILTPSNDTLIGSAASRTLVEGIPDAEETVLAGTGHLFRFTHPTAYAGAIATFLERRLGQRAAA